MLFAGVGRTDALFQTPRAEYILRLMYVHVPRNDSQVMDC